MTGFLKAAVLYIVLITVLFSQFKNQFQELRLSNENSLIRDGALWTEFSLVKQNVQYP